MAMVMFCFKVVAAVIIFLALHIVLTGSEHFPRRFIGNVLDPEGPRLCGSCCRKFGQPVYVYSKQVSNK
jgi:hypothetical protein